MPPNRSAPAHRPTRPGVVPAAFVRTSLVELETALAAAGPDPAFTLSLRGRLLDTTGVPSGAAAQPAQPAASTACAGGWARGPASGWRRYSAAHVARCRAS